MTTVLNPSNFRCRMHGKSAFVSKESAEAMIARAYQRRQKTGHDVPRMPKRAYLGECGWWHLAGTHLREGHGSAPATEAA